MSDKPTDIELLAACLVFVPRLALAKSNENLSVELRIAALHAEVALRALEIACRMEPMRSPNP